MGSIVLLHQSFQKAVDLRTRDARLLLLALRLELRKHPPRKLIDARRVVQLVQRERVNGQEIRLLERRHPQNRLRPLLPKDSVEATPDDVLHRPIVLVEHRSNTLGLLHHHTLRLVHLFKVLREAAVHRDNDKHLLPVCALGFCFGLGSSWVQCLLLFTEALPKIDF